MRECDLFKILDRRFKIEDLFFYTSSFAGFLFLAFVACGNFQFLILHRDVGQIFYLILPCFAEFFYLFVLCYNNTINNLK